MKFNIFLFIFFVFAACQNEVDHNIKSCDSRVTNNAINKQNDTGKVLLKNGDILFINSNSRQSIKISMATHSNLTHCGIYWNFNGKDFVYEAANNVELNPLNEFILQSNTESAIVKRLHVKSDSLVIKRFLNENLGKKYDILFLWNNNEMYCSELVYKAFEAANIDLCKKHKLKEYDLKSKTVMNELNKRYNNKIPYNEIMVAPSDLYNSILLDSIGVIK